MQTGRRDGMVSDKSLADDMPDVNDSIQTLKAKFVSKGLNDKDLVVLSGNTSLSFNLLCTCANCFYQSLHITY